MRSVHALLCAGMAQSCILAPQSPSLDGIVVVPIGPPFGLIGDELFSCLRGLTEEMQFFRNLSQAQ